MMFLYCLLAMAILVKINFNNWFIEFTVYFMLGVLWVFPSMYILRPFKKMTRKKNNSFKMRDIRKRIDLIDSKILPLMVKRSFLVNEALELKSKKSDIVDLKRINQIKKKVSSHAKRLGGNPKLISDIWASIIKNFINFERKNFKK